MTCPQLLQPSLDVRNLLITDVEFTENCKIVLVILGHIPLHAVLLAQVSAFRITCSYSEFPPTHSSVVVFSPLSSQVTACFKDIDRQCLCTCTKTISVTAPRLPQTLIFGTKQLTYEKGALCSKEHKTLLK